MPTFTVPSPLRSAFYYYDPNLDRGHLQMLRNHIPFLAALTLIPGGWSVVDLSAQIAEKSPVKNVEEAENETSVVRCTAIFDPEKNGTTAYVSLDPMSAGERVTLQMILVNKMERAIELKRMTVGCSCSTAKFPETKMLPGDSVSGELKIKLPKVIGGGKFNMTLAFYDQPAAEPVATVQLTIPLSGMLDIEQEPRLFELSEQVQNWRIPISITEPISIQDLELTKSKSLEDVELSLNQTPDGPVVDVFVADGMLGEEGLAGSFCVTCPSRKLKVDRYVSFVRKKPLTISPGLLRFRLVDGEEDRLEATALLMLNGEARGNQASVDKATEGERIEKVILEIGDKAVNASFIPLGKGSVVRLKVIASSEWLRKIVSKNDVLGESGSASWVVTTNEQIYKLPTLFLENEK